MGIRDYIRANIWKIISCYLIWVLAVVVVYNNIAVTDAYNTAYKAGCWNSFVDLQNSNYAIVNGLQVQKNTAVPAMILNITPG